MGRGTGGSPASVFARLYPALRATPLAHGLRCTWTATPPTQPCQNDTATQGYRNASRIRLGAFGTRGVAAYPRLTNPPVAR